MRKASKIIKLKESQSAIIASTTEDLASIGITTKVSHLPNN